MKVVFDANINISAFVIPGGNAEKAFKRAFHNDFELYTSIAILAELARKLEEKFGWEKQKIAKLITYISKIAKVLKTIPRINILSDTPDNRILECASEGNADLLITGDKHLLKIKHYENFKIIQIDGMTAQEVEQKLKAVQPEQRKVFRSATTDWSFDHPEESEVWNDNGDWKLITDKPKFQQSVTTLSEQEITDLASGSVDASVKNTILNKVSAKVSQKVDNQTVVTVVETEKA